MTYARISPVLGQAEGALEVKAFRARPWEGRLTKITKDVARDPLALVEVGEASEDSHRLEEETARERKVASSALPPPRPPPDREMETLKHTKELVRLKSWLLGLAIALTLAPLSFAFEGGTIRFLLCRDAPGAALGLWAAALAGWVACAAIARRVRAAGL